MKVPAANNSILTQQERREQFKVIYGSTGHNRTRKAPVKHGAMPTAEKKVVRQSVSKGTLTKIMAAHNELGRLGGSNQVQDYAGHLNHSKSLRQVPQKGVVQSTQLLQHPDEAYHFIL